MLIDKPFQEFWLQKTVNLTCIGSGFHFKGVVFSSQFKSKVGNILVEIPIDKNLLSTINKNAYW